MADAVHAEGGRIFLQLWHVGRVSHPSFQPGGALPVGPSALPVPGKTFIADAEGNGVWSEIPTPQALTAEGIADIVQDYLQAARNAMEAGMDGVEIHAGNGCLLDQFINSESNHRADTYGGSIENRARFLLEVVDAVTAEIGAGRVGVRLTPMGRFMRTGDATPEATFGHIARSLDAWPLAYLHLVEPAMVGTVKDEVADPRWDSMIHTVRAEYRGVLMLAGGYDGASAEQAIADGRADMIAFGRPASGMTARCEECTRRSGQPLAPKGVEPRCAPKCAPRTLPVGWQSHCQIWISTHCGPDLVGRRLRCVGVPFIYSQVESSTGRCRPEGRLAGCIDGGARCRPLSQHMCASI